MAYTLGLQVITTPACNYCLIIIVTTWFKHKIITNTVKYGLQTGKKALKIWNAYKYMFRRAVKQLFYTIPIYLFYLKNSLIHLYFITIFTLFFFTYLYIFISITIYLFRFLRIPLVCYIIPVYTLFYNISNYLLLIHNHYYLI